MILSLAGNFISDFREDLGECPRKWKSEGNTGGDGFVTNGGEEKDGPNQLVNGAHQSNEQPDAKVDGP